MLSVVDALAGMPGAFAPKLVAPNRNGTCYFYHYCIENLCNAQLHCTCTPAKMHYFTTSITAKDIARLQHS